MIPASSPMACARGGINIMKYVMLATSSNFGNMFSMAGGALFLPLLPMLPVRILLNNLLYDLSEIALPLDRVDHAMAAKPRHWDIKAVRRFMPVFGPVSSLFDFLIFALLLGVFRSDETLFHTGWFVESLATQVLVIFVLRTGGNFFASRPHPLLTVASLSAILLAVALPYTITGDGFGFSPLPLPLLLAFAAMRSTICSPWNWSSGSSSSGSLRECGTCNACDGSHSSRVPGYHKIPGARNLPGCFIRRLQ
jgi:P-type Mg2+ transporter